MQNYHRALEAYSEVDDPLGQAIALSHFGGGLLWKLGRLEEASSPS